uniref:RNA cytidine acetyltransferase 1-like n=1 Tax=Tanacetum cinerariifolium TaxID=118510 RepID=A0A6L2MWU0_TANCI|nr:RNA cytidine acetyltransferase 1-like [Tanacetum cinerariifolium]
MVAEVCGKNPTNLLVGAKVATYSDFFMWAKAVGHFLDAILDKTLRKTVGLLAGRGRRSCNVKFVGIQMPASQVHQMGRRVLIMSCDEHGEISEPLSVRDLDVALGGLTRRLFESNQKFDDMRVLTWDSCTQGNGWEFFGDIYGV